jgi:hypothetical protein
MFLYAVERPVYGAEVLMYDPDPLVAMLEVKLGDTVASVLPANRTPLTDVEPADPFQLNA